VFAFCGLGKILELLGSVQIFEVKETEKEKTQERTKEEESSSEICGAKKLARLLSGSGCESQGDTVVK